MDIRLCERTADTVKIYFERANTAEIRRFLPQKARTLEEALSDYEKSLLPGSNSYGKTIYADEDYIGDIWCYCIDLNDEPNAMISYCIFDESFRSKGIGAAAVGLFINDIREKYGIKTIGAFTFSENTASIKVLEKNGFSLFEEFYEDGVSSKYFQYKYALE